MSETPEKRLAETGAETARSIDVFQGGRKSIQFYWAL
jgi:hypothetical protein